MAGPVESIARRRAKTIAFLLAPNFSMIAFTTAIEPLRVANRVLGWPAYEWRILSLSGAAVSASNGVTVAVDGPMEPDAPTTAATPDMLIVCSGLAFEAAVNRRMSAALRRWRAGGAAVGGLCTGAWLLAEAGLLDERRCVIHWENLPAFAERFPLADVRADLFQIDGGIYTCAGGTAPLDMMLRMIGDDLDQEVVAAVCEQLITDRVRDHSDTQRIPLRSRIDVVNHKLLQLVRLMEANIAEPLSLAQIADRAGMSRRQIERLFRRHLAQSPARYYLQLRVSRAHLLLVQSDLPVVQVALACGFVSASHFSKCYRAEYGHPPVRDRIAQAS